MGRDIDSTYLQPLKDSLPDLGGVVGDWPVWGEISESTGQLIDGFQDIIGGMNDLVSGDNRLCTRNSQQCFGSDTY